MSEAVEELIIKPMLAIYPPPQHLRHPERQAAALAAYRRALAPFDRPALSAGWERVTTEHQFWVWPNPGTIAEACRRFTPPPPAVNEAERRREQAIGMADDYAARFMKTTHLAQLARKEGWDARLGEYVRDAAWVQAQLICGVTAVGFPSILIPKDRRHLGVRDAFCAHRETIDGAIERGRVRVTVPPALVREWKGAGRCDPAPAPTPGVG